MLDSSQTIYRRKISWREIGIQIVGRTRVLRVNYRNTKPILSKAYGVIRELDASGIAACEAGGEYVVPDRALRDGPHPQFTRFGSFGDERRHAREWIETHLTNGVSPEEVLVLGRYGNEMKTLEEWLRKTGLSVQLLDGKPRMGAVRLSTIHSAKGLDAEHVLVLSAHQLQGQDFADGRRLLYIAMTRARTDLCISYYGDSALISELFAAS